MQIALDPYMFRRLALPDVVRLAAELGYECVELSPRSDFLPLFISPRADVDLVREFKQACRVTGVKLVSIMAVYRWASPEPEERRAAVRYWMRAVRIATELECAVINTEFTGVPQESMASEHAFWSSLEELLPIFERSGIRVDIEPHPGDFVENGNAAVDIVRAIGSAHIKYLYCAPHTFHMGSDMAGMLRYAAPVLAHVHVADTLNHNAGLRYIINPIGAPVRVHQHLNIGEGEVNWDEFFRTLAEISFDCILTSCVFAWEDRAVQSSRAMLDRIQHYLTKFPSAKMADPGST